MKDEKVDFTRVCNLKMGDKFLECGTWKKVVFINSEVIKFKALHGSAHRVLSKGKNSQQIIQVARVERDKQDSNI